MSTLTIDPTTIEGAVGASFIFGTRYERGRTIALDTRRSPERRERTLMREASELLAMDPVGGADQAAFMLKGYAAVTS